MTNKEQQAHTHTHIEHMTFRGLENSLLSRGGGSNPLCSIGITTPNLSQRKFFDCDLSLCFTLHSFPYSHNKDFLNMIHLVVSLYVPLYVGGPMEKAIKH